MNRSFPAVVLVARHGRMAAIALAVLLALVVIASGTVANAPTGWAVAAAVGIAGWAVLRLIAEVIEVMADTLLPR